MEKQKKLPGSHWRNQCESKKLIKQAAKCSKIDTFFQKVEYNPPRTTNPVEIMTEASCSFSTREDVRESDSDDVPQQSSLPAAIDFLPKQEPQSSDAPRIHPQDPANPLSTERLDLRDRISSGPYQPLRAAYPKTTDGRCFRKLWFDEFKWLEYSEKTDRAYCFYCRFFSTVNNPISRGSASDAFIRAGFNNWTKATVKFRAHELSHCHASSMTSFNEYTKTVDIDCQLAKQKEIEISEREKQRIRNREALSRLVDIVICLAKGGRPFRGHDESKESHERGLFLELVNLIAKYDPILKNHLNKSPANATYLSNRSQNDMIRALHCVILQKIKEELSGIHVSIMADETSDCGHSEQLAIVIRYFNNQTQQPSERFISMKRLDTTTGEAIFNAIHEVEQELGIRPENIVGVCFDGASNMAGCESGVQARYKEINKNIVFFLFTCIVTHTV